MGEDRLIEGGKEGKRKKKEKKWEEKWGKERKEGKEKEKRKRGPSIIMPCSIWNHQTLTSTLA